jgi:hypothetical protein
MSNLERARNALEMAAVQADHYPEGYGGNWGKDIDGEWTSNPEDVAEYG